MTASGLVVCQTCLVRRPRTRAVVPALRRSSCVTHILKSRERSGPPCVTSSQP